MNTKLFFGRPTYMISKYPFIVLDFSPSISSENYEIGCYDHKRFSVFVFLLKFYEWHHSRDCVVPFYSMEFLSSGGLCS